MHDMVTPDPTWSKGERLVSELHGDLLIKRYQMLVDAGYTVDGYGFGSFTFKHPRKAAPPLSLWADGQVVDLHPTKVSDGERIIIDSSDSERFERLILRTPRPYSWQRAMSAPTGESLFVGLIWLTLAGLSVAASSCIGSFF